MNYVRQSESRLSAGTPTLQVMIVAVLIERSGSGQCIRCLSCFQ